jgi:SSS family solute:Na+ symporter
VVKDILILGVAVALGIYLPWRYYGGYEGMFRAVEQAKPGLLDLPARGLSASWFISTVVLNGVGFYMWPHAFAASYTAKSEDVFRKNAVAMPLYQLIMLFVFFIGFTAIGQVPGLKGPDADLALLRISRLSFPPWIVGVIGAAGVLTALVPGSMLLMTAATILAKNVAKPAFPRLGERGLGVLARALVPVLALLAVWITLGGNDTLVPLLLMGYNIVTQLAPALFLSLGARPLASPAGAFAGIHAGEATVAWISLSGTTLAKLFPAWPAWITDLNIGIVAMAVNVAALVVVSALTRGRAGPARA